MKLTAASGREVTIKRLGRCWYRVSATDAPTPGPLEWVRMGTSWATFTRRGAIRSGRRWLRREARDAWATPPLTEEPGPLTHDDRQWIRGHLDLAAELGRVTKTLAEAT